MCGDPLKDPPPPYCYYVGIWDVLNVKEVTKNSQFFFRVKFCRDLDFCLSFVSSALILHLTASLCKILTRP
jgi:hypothetical protein